LSLKLNLILKLVEEFNLFSASIVAFILSYRLSQVVYSLNVEWDQSLLNPSIIKFTFVLQVYHHLVLFAEKVASFQDKFTNDYIDPVVSLLK
jgi:hypothetical protein